MNFSKLFPSKAGAKKTETHHVVEEKEFEELKAAVELESRTTLVNVASPIDSVADKKRKHGALNQKNRTMDDVVAPPIAVPNNKTPGNGFKSRKVENVPPQSTEQVMRLLYDDGHALLDVLSEMKKFTQYLHLLINDDGLELQVLHSSRTLNILLRVPRSSFVKYDNLHESAICPVVSSKAVEEVAKYASANQTLSLLYHQCERSDEPLHVQLHPRDGNSATALAFSHRLNTFVDEDKVEVVPEFAYQYQIVFNAAQFYAAVKRLASTANTLVLMLRSDETGQLCFEIGGVSDAMHNTSSLRFGHSDEPTSVQCTITRLVPENAREANLDYFLNHRVLGVLLEAAAHFGTTAPASMLTLRIGIEFDATNGYNELPISMSFPMRSNTQAPFTVDVTVGTKIGTI